MFRLEEGGIEAPDRSDVEPSFEVTDKIPLDREAIQVPLVMTGEGKVGRTRNGRIEITLPDRTTWGRSWRPCRSGCGRWARRSPESLPGYSYDGVSPSP